MSGPSKHGVRSRGSRLWKTAVSIALLGALIIVALPASVRAGSTGPGGGGSTCTGYIDATTVSTAPGIKMWVNWTLSPASGYHMSNFEFLYGINTQSYQYGPNSWTSRGALIDLSSGVRETIYFEIVAVVTGSGGCDSYIYHDGTSGTFDTSTEWAGIEISDTWNGPSSGYNPCGAYSGSPAQYSGTLQATEGLDNYLDGQNLWNSGPTSSTSAWSFFQSYPTGEPLGCEYSSTMGPTVSLPPVGCSSGSGPADVYAAQLTVTIQDTIVEWTATLDFEMGLEVCQNGQWFSAYAFSSSSLTDWQALATDALLDIVTSG
jgi:hypothetical protein